jgi:hypothetical protein
MDLEQDREAVTLGILRELRDLAEDIRRLLGKRIGTENRLLPPVPLPTTGWLVGVLPDVFALQVFVPQMRRLELIERRSFRCAFFVC